MKDTLFVQFIVKTFLSNKTSPLDHDNWVYGLVNGFSDTYDLCNFLGDFHWVDLNLNNRIKSAKETKIHCDKIKFPIEEGRAFVSCVYPAQLYQVYSWAKRYPNVQFIAGGNVVDRNKLQWDDKDIPPNMILTELSVEQYFNRKDFSFNWKLNAPTGILNQKNHPIFFTYNLSNTCYWGNCHFCHYFGRTKRNRKDYLFEFDTEFEHSDVFKMCTLYSPSLSPSQIYKVFSNLPNRDDFFYRMYVRGDTDEINALESEIKFFKPELFEPFIGVEFPSERMNNIINKGISINTLIKSINRLGKIGTKVSIGIILGLPDLIENDLNELKTFLDRIEKYDNVSIKINKLFARWGTPAHDLYKPKYPWKVGPFYQGFNPIISDEALELNDRAYEMIENSGITLMSNYKVIREVEKDPQQKHRLLSGIVGTEK